MVEEGTLVRDFRFRGFPNRSMEKPTLPVTVPYGDSPPADETMTVWVRSHRQLPGGDGLVYGERHVDNAPRPRGLKNPPLDAPMDARQGYWRDGADGGSQNYTQELLQDLRREKESYRLRSPQRGNMPEPRGSNQNGYDPNSSQYQPSFAHGHERSGADSPRRGTRVTDFIKHDVFEDRYTYGQGGRDIPPNQGGASSPRVGIPVTEFIKPEEFEVRSSPRQNGPDPQTSRGGASSPKKEMWGTPVIDFMKHDEFEGIGQANQGQKGLDLQSNDGGASVPRREPQRGIPVTDFIKRDDMEGQGYGTRDPQTNRTDANSPRRDIREPPVNGYPGSRGPERSPGRSTYRLPPEESPVYHPFGRAGAGAPIVNSDGKMKTNVFGNFEKKSDPREVEKDIMAKKTMRQDLYKGREEQRNKREQDMEFQRRPDIDLADLMRGKEVGRPRVDPRTGILTNHPLPSSDVSKLKGQEKLKPHSGDDKKMNYQPRDGKETEEYRKFLQQQMVDRERSRQQERDRQRNESDQHFAKFDSQWGHMGGGAPTDTKEHRKIKLEESLRGSTDRPSDNPASYRVTYYDEDRSLMPGDVTPRYVKNMIDSSSKQFYQLPPGTPSRWVSPSYDKIRYQQDVRHTLPDASPRYVRNTIASTSTNFYQYPSARANPSYYRTNAPYATGYTYGI